MVTRTRRRGRKDGEEKNAKVQRRKDAREEKGGEEGNAKVQRCKGARAQGKPGSQNLETLFFTLPSYLNPTCNLECNPLPSPVPLLLFFFSSLRPCAFAPLRFLLLLLLLLLLLFFTSLRSRFSRLDIKKSAESRRRRIG